MHDECQNTFDLCSQIKKLSGKLIVIFLMWCFIEKSFEVDVNMKIWSWMYKFIIQTKQIIIIIIYNYDLYEKLISIIIKLRKG